jgi:hypothetical protein
VINPLAIGVTIGGLLLDRVAPRPKPRAGIAEDSLPFSARSRREDTGGRLGEQYERPSIAGGVPN